MARLSRHSGWFRELRDVLVPFVKSPRFVLRVEVPALYFRNGYLNSPMLFFSICVFNDLFVPPASNLCGSPVSFVLIQQRLARGWLLQMALTQTVWAGSGEAHVVVYSDRFRKKTAFVRICL